MDDVVWLVVDCRVVLSTAEEEAVALTAASAGVELADGEFAVELADGVARARLGVNISVDDDTSVTVDPVLKRTGVVVTFAELTESEDEPERIVLDAISVVVV